MIIYVLNIENILLVVRCRVRNKIKFYFLGFCSLYKEIGK